MLSLLLLLLVVNKPVEFIHPKTHTVITPTRVKLQVRVEPNSENRSVVLSWFGLTCGGRWAKTLEGANDRKYLPVEPIWVEINNGSCEFTAEVKGPGGKVLAREIWEVMGTERLDGNSKNSSRAGSVLAR